MKNRIRTEVSLASHTHQVPHIGLPQIEPVTRAMAVNMAPTGAIARPATSARGWRQMSAAAALAATRA